MGARKKAKKERKERKQKERMQFEESAGASQSMGIVSASVALTEASLGRTDASNPASPGIRSSGSQSLDRPGSVGTADTMRHKASPGGSWPEDGPSRLLLVYMRDHGNYEPPPDWPGHRPLTEPPDKEVDMMMTATSTAVEQITTQESVELSPLLFERDDFEKEKPASKEKRPKSQETSSLLDNAANTIPGSVASGNEVEGHGRERRQSKSNFLKLFR